MNYSSLSLPAKKRIMCVVGTRPEAIKMAPVILALKATEWADVRVLATAQHREMLDQVLDVFGIVPDVDLNIMRPNQALPELTSRLITEADAVLGTEKPDVVLVQGDTTTVLSVAMAAFYRRIAIGHVEAGLRTGDLSNPFPEEMNRALAARLAKWHFAPTERSKANLIREGISESSIHKTGNTVIDALLGVCHRDLPMPIRFPQGKRLILVTAHRRENFGAPLTGILRALRTLVEQRDDIHIMFPVHPNPNVSGPAHAALGDHPAVTLCAPLDYLPFVAAMRSAHIILTDSGGVQEEAPALGKPVLVLRRETERPEAVEAGVVKLVGTDCEAIVREATRLLDDSAAYAEMAKGTSPYGDGRSAARIVHLLQQDLQAYPGS